MKYPLMSMRAENIYENSGEIVARVGMCGLVAGVLRRSCRERWERWVGCPCILPPGSRVSTHDTNSVLWVYFISLSGPINTIYILPQF